MEKIFLGELIGTLVLILFGTGTCAANCLNKSFAKDTGWVFIAFGWGFAVFAGAVVSAPLSGAHLNPAVSFGFLLQGTIGVSDFLVYVVAQILGAILGAGLTYQLYYDHFSESEPGPWGGVFFTGPAIPNTFRNLMSEIIGTFILVFFIFMVGHDKSANSLFVPFHIVGIGIALGSLTGYAINPARDLGPRIMYSMTRLNKDKSANWSYAFIPIIGPLIGAGIASALFMIMKQVGGL